MVGTEKQERVKVLLRGFMDAWIRKQYEEVRRIEEQGVSPGGILAPFHDALVPGIRGLGERGFSTALGNLHERQLEAAAAAPDRERPTHSGEEHYFEIKSAKPNKGQCIEMKQRLLTAIGIRRSADVHAWWGVPYNPYGTAEAYGHPYPARFFDFTAEVKLGASFWNFVGDDGGTYEFLLDLYRQVGAEYAQQLDELRRALAGRPV